VLLLTLPFIAVLHRRLPAAFSAPHVRWPLIGLFTILAWNYLLRGSVVRPMQAGQEAWLVLTSINGVALLTIFIIYVVVALRTAHGEHRARHDTVL
jgi:hypothetical protein